MAKKKTTAKAKGKAPAKRKAKAKVRPKAKAKRKAPAKAKAKAKGGRPSKFDGIDQEQIRKLAQSGWTDAQMSGFFGVTEQTWNNWKAAHPEFFESLKDWKSEADHEVERSLFKRACGFTVTEMAVNGTTTREVPPDSTACIFWLKNRRPKSWRDKREVEHSGDVEVTLLTLLDDDLAEAVRDE